MTSVINNPTKYANSPPIIVDIKANNTYLKIITNLNYNYLILKEIIANPYNSYY